MNTNILKFKLGKISDKNAAKILAELDKATVKLEGLKLEIRSLDILYHTGRVMLYDFPGSYHWLYNMSKKAKKVCLYKNLEYLMLGRIAVYYTRLLVNRCCYSSDYSSLESDLKRIDNVYGIKDEGTVHWLI